MKKHKIKIENEMKSLLAKVERERKLMETNYTAKRIAYESETAQKMNEEKITHYLFNRNAVAPPGHLRIPEAQEMADELASYIETLDIPNWE